MRLTILRSCKDDGIRVHTSDIPLHTSTYERHVDDIQDPICNNSLQLKAVYYSTVTRSSILVVGRGPKPALITMVFRKILS